MTQVLPRNRAREYESIFILNPESQTDVIDTVSKRCTDVISSLDGKLLRAENWGRRRLAYPVKRNNKGIYIYLRYLGYQTVVHELERYFRRMDSIIKFISVKVDEDIDPDARPVSEGDISFVSTFVEPVDSEPHEREGVEETAGVARQEAGEEPGYDGSIEEGGSKKSVEATADSQKDNESSGEAEVEAPASADAAPSNEASAEHKEDENKGDVDSENEGETEEKEEEVNKDE